MSVDVPVIETDRLILRTIEENDAAEQDRVLNTPTVMAHLGGVKEIHEIEAKHARAMASSRLKCIFYRTFTFSVRSARGPAIIARPWKFFTGDFPSPTCWT